MRTMARTPQSTRTCTMRSSEHAAHRLLMHSGHTSHLWLKVSFHVIHACAPVCCSLSVSPHLSFHFLVLFLFQLYLMSNSAPDEFSIEDPLCNSSLGSMVTLDYVTPLTGHEPKEMELTDADELNLATTSDIYFQNTLDDTASFPNDPDVDDNELAEFLAVVVDGTGKPVEVRSNNDQFSCDIRNLKSAQSQFPFVTQPQKDDQSNCLFKKGSLRSAKPLTHRLGQCWMNSEERSSLNAVKKFFITNSSQLKPNKIAKFCKKNCSDNNRIFVKFISKIL